MRIQRLAYCLVFVSSFFVARFFFCRMFIGIFEQLCENLHRKNFFFWFSTRTEHKSNPYSNQKVTFC